MVSLWHVSVLQKQFYFLLWRRLAGLSQFWLYISGSAYKIVTKRALHHGTMLLATRLDTLGSILRPPQVGIVLLFLVQWIPTRALPFTWPRMEFPRWSHSLKFCFGCYLSVYGGFFFFLKFFNFLAIHYQQKRFISPFVCFKSSRIQCGYHSRFIYWRCGRWVPEGISSFNQCNCSPKKKKKRW